MTRGWEAASSLSAISLAHSLVRLGVERIIYTDIARDGMLSGPNINQTVDLAKAAGLKVTASGGISCLEDIRRLREANEPLVDSVIIGKALYEAVLLWPTLSQRRRIDARCQLASPLIMQNMSSKVFSDDILKGRVAFVTGGGTGITGGIARAFAEAGAAVALVSRQITHLEPAAAAINESGGQALAVVADVRNPDEVAKAVAATVDRFGHLDIVVNGAAGNFLCPAEQLSPNGFGAVVDIDLKGTFNVCRAAFEQLQANRGQILNISATLHYLGTRCNYTSRLLKQASMP